MRKEAFTQLDKSLPSTLMGGKRSTNPKRLTVFLDEGRNGTGLWPETVYKKNQTEFSMKVQGSAEQLKKNSRERNNWTTHT